MWNRDCSRRVAVGARGCEVRDTTMQMDEMMESRVDGMAPILGAMSLLMDEGLAEQMHRKERWNRVHRSSFARLSVHAPEGNLSRSWWLSVGCVQEGV